MSKTRSKPSISCILKHPRKRIGHFVDDDEQNAFKTIHFMYFGTSSSMSRLFCWRQWAKPAQTSVFPPGTTQISVFMYNPLGLWLIPVIVIRTLKLRIDYHLEWTLSRDERWRVTLCITRPYTPLRDPLWRHGQSMKALWFNALCATDWAYYAWVKSKSQKNWPFCCKHPTKYILTN
jgi:hypothetical protein